jgi:hypothetical protein
MSTETEVGNGSLPRLWFCLLGWGPAVEVGDIDEEELGKGDNDNDWWDGCLQSAPVAATKVASLAAISRILSVEIQVR